MISLQKKIIVILSILAVELVGNSKTVQLVGCPTYAAPEVLCGSEYDEKADIWSLGCAIYEVCKGYQLFYNEAISDIIRAQYSKPAINLGVYSEDLQEFIKSLLVLDPNKRITASEAAKHLRLWKPDSAWILELLQGMGGSPDDVSRLSPWPRLAAAWNMGGVSAWLKSRTHMLSRASCPGCALGHASTS